MSVSSRVLPKKYVAINVADMTDPKINEQTNLLTAPNFNFVYVNTPMKTTGINERK